MASFTLNRSVPSPPIWIFPPTSKHDELPHVRLHKLLLLPWTDATDTIAPLCQLTHLARTLDHHSATPWPTPPRIPPDLDPVASSLEACLTHLSANATANADGVLLLRDAYNTVFWTGVRARCVPLVQVAVAESRWQLCPAYRERLPGMLVDCAEQLPGHVWSMLVADRQRFGDVVVDDVLEVCIAAPYMAVVNCVPSQRKRQVQATVAALLREPHVDPGLVWDKVLQMCLEGVVEPRAVHVGEVLVDGRWQFARAARQATRWPGPRHSLDGHCANSRLLLDLPIDVLLHLVDLLDWHDIRQLRSTCRALNNLPLGRFATLDALERELHSSSLPGYVYNSTRLQSLLASVPGFQISSTLASRVLVEAVRHLDVPLAMPLLDPPPLALHLSVERYAYPWALYVLLFESTIHRDVPAARHLLLALLTHRTTPASAWLLPALAFTQTTRHLLPLLPLDYNTLPTTPCQAYLLHVLAHGSLPRVAPPYAVFRDMTSSGPPTATFRVVAAQVLAQGKWDAVAHLVHVLGLRPAYDAELCRVLVRLVMGVVPVDRWVGCEEGKVVASVYRWMMLELESEGGWDERRVVGYARAVGKRLKEVVSREHVGVDGKEREAMRELCLVGERQIRAVERAMEWELEKARWRRRKDEGRRAVARALGEVRGACTVQ